MSKRIYSLLVLLLGLLSAASFVFAQAGRAELSGTIQDPSGLPVPKDGFMTFPEAPGLGFEPDRDTIAEIARSSRPSDG